MNDYIIGCDHRHSNSGPPPLFPHLVPPAIMVCFLSKTAAGPRNKS